MIIIPLLFPIIIITTILKAECDLTNKKVKDSLNKPEEVCLTENMRKDLDKLAKNVKDLKKKNEVFKANQDKLFGRTDMLRTSLKEREEWIEGATKNIETLFDRTQLFKTNQDKLIEKTAALKTDQDKLIEKVNVLKAGQDKFIENTAALKADQDKLFNWGDEITASINNMKKSWNEQMEINHEQTKINNYFYSEIDDLVSDPDSDPDSDSDSDSDPDSDD
jgi:DNA repair exonuclease SbcCD ATPase subunit